MSSKGSNKQDGWALLGLILALMVMGIALVAAVPSVRVQVQREKEEELMYRGDEMAKAIARWYNFGNLGPINLQSNAGFGPLTELKQLREIMLFNGKEIKFARNSSFIDPLTNEEWEPVRLRDPRIAQVLDAYAALPGVIIPPSYLSLAGPPPKVILNPSFPSSGGQSNSNSSPTNRNTRVDDPDADPDDPDDDDDDDDDDDEPDDPLGHFFDKDRDSKLPIVGVAPKWKGPSIRLFLGAADLGEYNKWVFIYVPTQNTRTPNSTGPGGGPPKVSR